MASMKEITCACGCRRKKMVRTADIARGWGKFFSKSCKAKEQEKRTGQHAKHKRKVDKARRTASRITDDNGYDPHPFSQEALGQWD